MKKKTPPKDRRTKAQRQHSIEQARVIFATRRDLAVARLAADTFQRERDAVTAERDAARAEVDALRRGIARRKSGLPMLADTLSVLARTVPWSNKAHRLIEFAIEAIEEMRAFNGTDPTAAAAASPESTPPALANVGSYAATNAPAAS